MHDRPRQQWRDRIGQVTFSFADALSAIGTGGGLIHLEHPFG
jgi:hypothetical protein